VRQLVPSQHPPPHDDGEQLVLLVEHTPAEHAWPALHALQLAPPFPHEASVCDAVVTQVSPWQHPVQVAGEHPALPFWQVPLTQSWPRGHAPQTAPNLPHEPAFSEEMSTQVVPSQHPEQVEASHVAGGAAHVPNWQVSPGSQGLHMALRPHEASVCAS
jgi:hypothetical protein